jgi:hypothetical protein
VEDRVITVLPALIDQAVRVPPAIFYEAIPIAVAMVFHPSERSLYIGPQSPQCRQIPGAL